MHGHFIPLSYAVCAEFVKVPPATHSVHKPHGLCTVCVAGGTPHRSVPFQFEFVSMTVVSLSIIESTNSLRTEFIAGDTPCHSLRCCFSASLRYETGE